MSLLSFSRASIFSLAVITFPLLGLAAPEVKGPASTDLSEHLLKVESKASLIHLGSLDSFDITSGGTGAAELIFGYLQTKDVEALKKAIDIYERIIPSENFGGEYTALNWLCHYFQASEADRKALLADPVTADWYRYLASDNFTPLKEYLKQKYHLAEWKHKKTLKSDPFYRFLEDLLLFNNPWREHWEKTSEILGTLNLKKGDVVADVGCGPGYFTYKFANLVGPTGTVYALDTNRKHIQYLSKLVKATGMKNIKPMISEQSGFNLENKADLVYLCSLYHNVYAMSTDEEREQFIGSIKKTLKPDGTLVIVDNALVTDDKIPYHGPYISKDLIIQQMWYNGFKLEKFYQFIPQRYILMFKLRPEGEPPVLAAPSEPLDPTIVPVLSKRSLVHTMANATSPGFTLAGRNAARLLNTALEKKTPEALNAAKAAYLELIPKERFGDEYTAFLWICDYLLASKEEQQKMTSQWMVRNYAEKLSANNFQELKTFLKLKYFFDAMLEQADIDRAGGKGKLVEKDEAKLPANAEMTQDQINAMGEYIAFCNPNREQWEQTSKMLDFLKIKPGQSVADLGSGAGYYTFKFSNLVGPEGTVYAVDTAQEQLDYVTQQTAKNNITNIKTVLARDNDPKLPENCADLVYICSMYHAAYFISMEYVRDGFINGIKKALRKGGRLAIADNAILGDKENRYYGPGIAPELIIAQLKHNGFRLVDRAQFIPQRYILVFERDEPAAQ